MSKVSLNPEKKKIWFDIITQHSQYMQLLLKILFVRDD